MIDVLVPVLGRPDNAQRVVDSLAQSGADAEITFICNPSDVEQIGACQATGARTFLTLWSWPDRGDYAKKINYAFRKTDGELFLNGADDLDFQPGWDTRALRAMKPGIGVVATNDKANRQVMRGEFGTHCLISRDYINQYGGTFDGEPGVVLYEGYDHCYVDRELCEAAKTRGAYAFAANSVVRHRHPLWKTAPWDDTYRKAVGRAREDAALFDQRLAAWNTSGQRDIVSR